MNKLSIISLFALVVIGLSDPARAEETITWELCIQESAKNHPDLISAQEAVKQTEAAKNINVSPVLPQVSADLNANFAKSSGGSSSTGTSRTGDSYSYGINGSQVIFQGLKNINNIKAASENIKAAKYAYKFTSSEVRLRLRTAFVNLLTAQELLVITKDIQKIRKSNLDLINLRYKSGTEHRGAMLTAEANLAQADFNIMQAERELEVAQRQLIKELGRTHLSPVHAQGEFSVNDQAREKPDFEALAEINPSLGKISAQANAASYEIKSAWGNFSPTISAQGGFNRAGTDWPPNENQWTAGIGLTLPLFQGGLRLAELSQAKAQYYQALADERSTKDGIVLSLEQTWASLQDAIASVGVQKKFLVAAEERAKIAEEQYSLGLLSYDNWTIIEDTLVNAKRAYLNSQTSALLAEANWIQAKGETLDYVQ
jgi:outer membrane protein TolC